MAKKPETAGEPEASSGTTGAAPPAESDKAPSGGEKQRRAHGERATASLRTANRNLREVSEPAERAQLMLAEANVLALLDLAAALRGSSANTQQ